ncbi:adenylosuccinate lyase family protein (plasmid) [Natrinema zhouii]|uniref:class-II fumarase/aspartase family protein n=1 Tax=Natrinema zhouii TaxID=1710539 RepID=UPI001CFFAD7C|nr:adenylosuccinate lyase family protein [Natrinema zhouii]UHQ98874.1 adenylosuccinate lyase family protein [Natrinema zhouii]
MASQVQGPLFADTFSTPAMREIFGTESYVDRFVRVEAALARAEASVGMIPEEVAETLTDRASVEHVDMDVVERYLDERGHLAMSIISGWQAMIGDEGEYVHWGATSQDVMDTTTVLQVRDGLDELLERLRAIEFHLADHVETHADTPMIGRTHYVHAVPTTFGLKAASWLDELRRQVDYLESIQESITVCQFGGAVGTYATFGSDGLEIADAFADELGLEVPTVGWHAARDRIARVVTALAAVASTLSRIARQVLVLNRPEIRELRDPVPEGEVGSSTMPHKRNPKRAEKTAMAAQLLRSEARSMLELMATLDERSASTWYGEFAVVPTAFGYADRCAESARQLVEGLTVDADRMCENLSIHGAFVTSENVMMALADHVGRGTAHEIVYENAMAADSDDEFVDRLLEDDRVTDALTPEEVASLTDPTRYTGLAAQLAERVVEEHPRV